MSGTSTPSHRPTSSHQRLAATLESKVEVLYEHVEELYIKLTDYKVELISSPEKKDKLDPLCTQLDLQLKGINNLITTMEQQILRLQPTAA